MTTDPRVALTVSLSNRVHPILAGHHPAIQGAVLADLLATWLAGHDPEVREALLEAHVHSVRERVPINEALFRG
jgi:hypothetical protein